MNEKDKKLSYPAPEKLTEALPRPLRHYESADPDRYEADLDLVETLDDLPQSEQDAIHARFVQLHGKGDLGDVEAMAYAMREHRSNN